MACVACDQVPILATLSDYEKLTIADALVQEEFPKGQVICVQGEPGNKFYIVEKVCRLAPLSPIPCPFTELPSMARLTIERQRCCCCVWLVLDGTAVVRVCGRFLPWRCRRPLKGAVTKGCRVYVCTFGTLYCFCVCVTRVRLRLHKRHPRRHPVWR